MKFAIVLLLSFFFSSSPTGVPPLGAIDFYGLRTVSESRVRQGLNIHEGDSIDMKHFEELQKDQIKKLEAIPGVHSASMTLVCCTDDHKSMIYIGVEEATSPCMAFQPEPTGNSRLTDDVILASRKLEEELEKAVLAGEGSEDDSAGHALGNSPKLRAAQLALLPLAQAHLQNLKDVLRQSSDESQRAIAAEVLGYASDKQDVVPDLVAAMRDSSSTVRNNAMRALSVFTRYKPQAGAKSITVPYQPFIAMLNSCVWTDRNKSSATIDELSQGRNPLLLRELEKNALPSLVEMANWKNLGHATSSLDILGRLGGLPEEQISKYIEAGNRKAIIAAAQTSMQRQ